MTHQFNWSELITDEVLQVAREATGVTTGVTDNILRESLSNILISLSRLPLVSNEPTSSQMTQLAIGFLDEALQKVISLRDFHRTCSGHYILESDNGEFLDQEIIGISKVAINTATASDLQQLPKIGVALADRIVTERSRNGEYRSITELAERVNGIGESTEKTLEHVFSFATAFDVENQVDLDMMQFTLLLQRIVNLVNEPNPPKRLLSALEYVATTCAGQPLVRLADQSPIESTQSPNIEYSNAEVVGLLQNSQYYFMVPDILAFATSSIDVMLFHAALPEPGHPTMVLLQSLVAAKDRGVTVRVILDSDRPTDPFLSTVINIPAKEFLTQNGVECRFDSVDQLLHSKILVVDAEIAVIGSHNWSAGSYFQLDDLSMVIKSTEYASGFLNRFEEIWNTLN